MKELDKFLEDLFGKLPNLPGNIREAIVKIAPYLAVLGVILALPAVFALIGISGLSGVYGGWGYAYGGTIGIIFSILNIVLLALSIRGLFARQAVGWRFVYYSVLVSAVYSILMVDILGFIIGTGISLYILFQVRSHYH